MINVTTGPHRPKKDKTKDLLEVRVYGGGKYEVRACPVFLILFQRGDRKFLEA